MNPDIPAHAVPSVTVSVNVCVVEPPGPVAMTVTRYDSGGMLAGCAFVTRTTPVATSAVSSPLKLVEVETLMLVMLVGAGSGVTVVSPLSGTDVFG